MLRVLELVLIGLFLMLGIGIMVNSLTINHQLGRFANPSLLWLTVTAGSLLIINAILMTINLFQNRLERPIQIINALIFLIAVIGLFSFGSHLPLQWLAEIGLVLYSVLIINFRR